MIFSTLVLSTLWLVVELVVLFFGVAFAIHLFQRRFGAARVRAWMSGPPVASALKGIGIGFITPFCTYSAIPMLIGFRQAGVPPAGYVAFITAAPVLDPVLFGALVVIVGLQAALIYTAVAFTAAMVLALVAQRVGLERHLKPLPIEATVRGAVPATVGSGGPDLTGAPLRPGSGEVLGGEPPCDDPGVEASTCGPADTPWRGLRAEVGGAAGAASTLLRSVALLLLAGVAVGLVIEATVSPDAVAALTGGHEAWSIPVAAALGTPLYVHTTLFVPIANALGNAGVGIGAIVALTISGAGANVPEFIILTRLARGRVIAIFFGYVFAVALVGGLIAEAILG